MAVLLYAFPGKEEYKLKYYVFPYIYPYFHQDWSMFVPVPTQNFNVYVRMNGEDWQDVIHDLNMKHQANRFGGNETSLLALTSALRFYSSTIEKEKSQIISDDNSNLNFEVVERIIKGYLVSKDKERLDGMEIIIRIRYVNTSVDFAHYYKSLK